MLADEYKLEVMEGRPSFQNEIFDIFAALATRRLLGTRIFSGTNFQRHIFRARVLPTRCEAWSESQKFRTKPLKRVKNCVVTFAMKNKST